MLRLAGPALAMILPIALASGCADPAIGPTIDTPPVLVPVVVDPPGPAPATTEVLVRCDDGGDAGGVIVDGVCL